MSKEVDRVIEVKEHNRNEILVREIGGTGMITVRGDLSNKQFQAAIVKNFYLDVPKPLNINRNESCSVAWMSSDELLILTYSETNVEKIKNSLETSFRNVHSLVLDVSGSRSLFTVEGPLWREVLAKGSPIDLRTKSFTQNSFVRTRMGQVSVAFWMASEHSAKIICGRSYSEFLYDWLCNAAKPGSLTKFF